MLLTRIKEDVTAISYEILRRSGLSVKFKVKTYYENINKSNSYYYTSYVFNKGSDKKYSINIVPKSYIQFEFGAEDGRNIFFLSEVYKARFVRKLTPLVKLLDDYDNGDIDILVVGPTGTHINQNAPYKASMKLGIHKVSAVIVIREDKLDVGVTITIDNMSATISMYDFIDLIMKIASINFMEMSILLLNHIGAPDIGTNSIDFRPNRIEQEERNSESDSVPSTDTLSSLKNSSKPIKKYKNNIW